MVGSDLHHAPTAAEEAHQAVGLSRVRGFYRVVGGPSGSRCLGLPRGRLESESAAVDGSTTGRSGSTPPTARYRYRKAGRPRDSSGSDPVGVA